MARIGGLHAAQHLLGHMDYSTTDRYYANPGAKVVVNDLPAGAMRMKQVAAGVDYTIVNGQVLIEGGEHTGAYPGRVVRNAAYSKA